MEGTNFFFLGACCRWAFDLEESEVLFFLLEVCIAFAAFATVCSMSSFFVHGPELWLSVGSTATQGRAVEEAIGFFLGDVRTLLAWRTTFGDPCVLALSSSCFGKAACLGLKSKAWPLSGLQLCVNSFSDRDRPAHVGFCGLAEGRLMARKLDMPTLWRMISTKSEYGYRYYTHPRPWIEGLGFKDISNAVLHIFWQ